MRLQPLGSCPATLWVLFRQGTKAGLSSCLWNQQSICDPLLGASYVCKIKPAFFQWLTKHSHQSCQAQFKFWHVAAVKDHMGVTESTECLLGGVQDIWTIRKHTLSVGDGQPCSQNWNDGISVQTEVNFDLCCQGPKYQSGCNNCTIVEICENSSGTQCVSYHHQQNPEPFSAAPHQFWCLSKPPSAPSSSLHQPSQKWFVAQESSLSRNYIQGPPRGKNKPLLLGRWDADLPWGQETNLGKFTSQHLKTMQFANFPDTNPCFFHQWRKKWPRRIILKEPSFLVLFFLG